MTTSMLIADLTDLVECVGGVVTADLRPVTAEGGRKVPHVHAVLPSGTEFKVARPTFRAARLELIDWLAIHADRGD